MQIIRKFFIVVMALFLPYFILSQYTFKELDSIINRCSLDSTRFYLEKQKAKAKSTSEYFRFYVNNAQYYRDIRDYKRELENITENDDIIILLFLLQLKLLNLL